MDTNFILHYTVHVIILEIHVLRYRCNTTIIFFYTDVLLKITSDVYGSLPLSNVHVCTVHPLLVSTNVHVLYTSLVKSPFLSIISSSVNRYLFLNYINSVDITAKTWI